MKLYDFSLAPNPRRVRIFLAEKGIEIPMVQVNTREAEQFSDWFQKINPRGTIPVLELDDGTLISESVAICRYFEETQPEPPLMGRDATDRAVVEMWNRRVEIEGIGAVAAVLRNTLPMFEDRAIAGIPSGVPQLPALAERGRGGYGIFLERLDERLGESRFIAGDGFTIADITAFVAIDTALRVEMGVPEARANVRRWQAEVAARPSASA
ncbi:MAG: glutathione S-transferase family protein [Alphaproteobacteria bacterium]|jgi:glutathione S-transferase|nr:glutathione S-transferase family protein [Alphaproteobacteria bacterium]MDP6816108.1 glutathione S-transferase family protein [Alphaproteobacteria bacterium]